MTAHRRGPLLRIAVVGALVSGAVLLPAAPALANVNVSPGGMELDAGQTREITATVNGEDAANPQATFTVSNDLSGEVTLSGCGETNKTVVSCDENDFNVNQVKVTAAAKNPSGLQPGQNRDGVITVRGNSNNDTDTVQVRVNGPERAASVTEVSGKVVNQATGEAVPNAQVTLRDSANSEHSATANGKGEFRITPQGNKPIVPGALTLTATIEGFSDGTANANGVAGKAVNNVQIRMKPTAASAPPSAPVASDGPTDDPSAAATDLAQPSKTSGDSGGPNLLSWLLIGMGVLLVLLGVGAIVLLLMRRKDDRDDQGDDFAQPGPNQMAPAGAGAYRGGPDRTMVAGSPGMNDATAIVGPQQPLDEFPDPYAAAPTRAGYGSYGGGADQATSVAPAPGYGRGGGYGEEPGYGRGEPGYSNGGGYRDERGYDASRGGGYGEDPRSGGGYGSGGGGNGYGGGGYGESPRGRYADEPTGQYSPGGGGYPPAGGYAGGAGGHSAPGGGPANGYGPAGGHAAPGGGPANGYGPAGGHAAPGGGPANGYGPAGGYDDAQRGDVGRQGGGYPSAGGYERPQGDYGAERGGDPRNGRGRSVDWLD